MPLFNVTITATVTVPDVEALTQAAADELVKQDVLTRFSSSVTVKAEVAKQ